MGIKTSTFGGVTLSGDSAKAFRKQFLSGKAKPNVQAQAALERGRPMLKELNKKGYITVKL